jgi:hypothetical protein
LLLVTGTASARKPDGGIVAAHMDTGKENVDTVITLVVPRVVGECPETHK